MKLSKIVIYTKVSDDGTVVKKFLNRKTKKPVKLSAKEKLEIDKNVHREEIA